MLMNPGSRIPYVLQLPGIVSSPVDHGKAEDFFHSDVSLCFPKYCSQQSLLQMKFGEHKVLSNLLCILIFDTTFICHAQI